MTTLPPAAFACVDRLRVTLDRALVDERTHERRRVDRIADAHLRVGVREPFAELVDARAMHEHAPRRRAALAGRADRAEHDGGHREFQIRGLIDDDRVVAAELEQRLAEPARDALGDVAADRRRAGERHQRHAPVVDETRRRARCRASMNSWKIGGSSCSRITLLQMCWTAIAVSGVFGDGFHTRRIAADRREERIPGPDRDRES